MEITTLKETDIIKVFADASKSNNIGVIEELLDEEGEFQIQNSANDFLDVGKQEFVTWYKTKLENALITEILFDHCLY